MSKQTVKVPDLGGASEVEVIEICVAVGDTISQDQSLIVVESDKASMDIPSPVAGVIVSIAVADGATISEGDVVLEVELAGSDSSAEAPAEVPAQEAAVEAAVESAVEPASESVTAPNPTGAPVTSVLSVYVPDLGGADKVELIEVVAGVGERISEGDG
ncbi:MAG TPA: pyruvate dehydrogenase complex dihydrolipoyllysine-residue acetyltransferase, partial [Cellvibrionales bacterium]|nr:pyruvate dehydrogenase complex dihydrolipoyllysine-residue acetyltransferase [Cellvibrionales bacterium]